MNQYGINEQTVKGYRELYELAEKKISKFSKQAGIAAIILLMIMYVIDLKAMYICFGILCFSPLTIPVILEAGLRKAKKELKDKYPNIKDIDSFSRLEFLMQEYDKSLESKEEVQEEIVNQELEKEMIYEETKD